jgi:transcriptional regulator with XRE-family HTH domain
MPTESTVYTAPNSFQKRSASSSVVFAAYPLLLVGLVGSGTGARVFDPSAALQRSAIYIDAVNPNLNIGRRRAELVHVQLISRIREGLRLNMSALASLLNVSRTALYAWLQGTPPRPDAMVRLARLASYAERVRSLNIARVDMLFHLPIKDGKNFLAILSEDSEVDEGIRLLAEHANARAARTLQRVGRSRGTGSISSNEEVSIDFSNLG